MKEYISITKRRMNWYVILSSVLIATGYLRIPFAVMDGQLWKWILVGTLFCVIGTCAIIEMYRDMKTGRIKSLTLVVLVMKVVLSTMLAWLFLDPYFDRP